MSANAIFIYREGKDQGPYTLEQVQAFVIIGTLSESDSAWYEGLGDWIPLSSAIAQLQQRGDEATDGWRRKIAGADEKAELRFLGLKVKRDLTKGACQDQIDEACKDSAAKSRLEEFRLKKAKEKEFLAFIQQNSFELRMNIPTVGQVRETIDFLHDDIPNWDTETSANEFAKLILVRYPDLKGNWDSSSAETDTPSNDWDDDSATERQLDYLRDLGATVSPGISKAEASELIDRLKNQATDAQKRRLNFFYHLEFGPNITKDEASDLIDRYLAEHPESEDAYQEWKIQQHIR